MPLSKQNSIAAKRASAFSTQRRLNFANASGRFTLPMAATVALTKSMGLVTKSAAEAEANHGLPQFIAVIENCSTVANDTQTKYGTRPTATQR